MNTLIDLKVGGGGAFDGKKVLIKEMQRDPVTRAALHADFFALDMTHTIEVSVPVHVSGTPVGVSLMGGILDQVLREVEVECLPHAIPNEIVIDVSHLEIGMSLHVRDLPLPKDVEMISDNDLSIVSVVAPKAIEEEAPAAEAGVEPGAVPVDGEAAAEAEAGGASDTD
jgi:large subunit ribosomal protein L25